MKMPWRHVTVLASIVWMLSGPAGLAAQAGGVPPIVSSITQTVPIPGDDSLTARIKACIAMGDVTCILTQWMAVKGVDRVPEWLALFQKSFEPANRQAGACVKVATSIHHGLLRLGQRPNFLRITLAGEQRKILGFDELVNGLLVRSHQIATNVQRLVPYPGMTVMVEVVESL